MRSNNLISIGEIFSLTVYDTSPDIQVWSYIFGSSKEVVSFTTTQINGYLNIDVTAPNEDCMLLIKVDDGISYVRVGAPPICMILHYIKSDNEDMIYKQMDMSGTILHNGPLTNIGDNFYIAPNITVEESFYDVLGGICTLTMPDRYFSTNECSDSGTILLQRGVWQLVAIPILENVVDGFLTALAVQTGKDVSTLIEVVNSYRGDLNKFLSFIPGVTNVTSEHNFPLKYNDSGSVEIVGMWVKCKVWTHTEDDILFSWSN